MDKKKKNKFEVEKAKHYLSGYLRGRKHGWKVAYEMGYEIGWSESFIKCNEEDQDEKERND